MGAGPRARPLGRCRHDSGYMGSGGIFDEAVGDFAFDYADQAEQDHKAFVKAVREERVKAVIES